MGRASGGTGGFTYWQHSLFKYNIQYFCGVKNDMSILLKRNIETNEQSRGYGVMGTRQ